LKEVNSIVGMIDSSGAVGGEILYYLNLIC